MKVFSIIITLIIFSSLAQAQDWQFIEDEHFIIRYKKNLNSALEIQNIAKDFYPNAVNQLGYSTGRKISIWFCETKDEFNRAVGAPIQDWAAGCAYPLQARIVILDPKFTENKRLNLSRILRHEIVHVIFGLYVGEYMKNVPRWFIEGVAMYVSDDWGYLNYWTMLTGTLSNALRPLYEISSDFPEKASSAQLAYSQSYSITAFMVKRYGMDAFRECINLISKGRPFDEAFAGATGANLDWFESRWTKDLKKHYRWFSLVSSWVVLWGIVILIAFIAYMRRKIKNRRIIKQWEMDEELWNYYEFVNDDTDEDNSETWTYRY